MKDFIPYNEALALKDLDFDEPCFGFSRNDRQDKKLEFTNIELAKNYNGINSKDLFLNKKEDLYLFVSRPTFSQAFRFFREKCKGKIWFDISQQVPYVDNYLVFINVYDGVGVGVEFEQEFTTYEQAELECLRKLIEICKSR